MIFEFWMTLSCWIEKWMCLLLKGKQTFYQIDESYIKDNIFLNLDENEAAYPISTSASSALMEVDIFSSHNNDITVWIKICCILPSIVCRQSPQEEICSHLYLTAPSAWLTKQRVIEPDRYVFQNKVESTMCAQPNNKAPVMIGRGTTSFDMPTGYIHLLSLQSWLGCLLA